MIQYATKYQLSKTSMARGLVVCNGATIVVVAGAFVCEIE